MRRAWIFGENPIRIGLEQFPSTPRQPRPPETKKVNSNSLAAPSSRGQWMTLAAAFLGWMFDGFEMGLFPLVGRPALEDLLGKSGQAPVDTWFGLMIAGFLVGAASGGDVPGEGFAPCVPGCAPGAVAAGG